MQLQTTNNRPDLIFTNGDAGTVVATGEDLLRFCWRNIGKRIAWCPKAKLFNQDESTGYAQQVGEVDINQTSGRKIFPTFCGTAEFRFPAGTQPRRPLVCVSYFDDRDRMYIQGFVLTIGNGYVTEQLPVDASGPCSKVR